MGRLAAHGDTRPVGLSQDSAQQETSGTNENRRDVKEQVKQQIVGSSQVTASPDLSPAYRLTHHHQFAGASPEPCRSQGAERPGSDNGQADWWSVQALR